MLSRVAETDLEGSSRCVIEVLSRGLPEEGNHEHSRASVPAKIRTWHLPNTSLQLHRYIQFLGISVTVGHFKGDKSCPILLYPTPNSCCVLCTLHVKWARWFERNASDRTREVGTTNSAHQNSTLRRSLSGKVWRRIGWELVTIVSKAPTASVSKPYDKCPIHTYESSQSNSP
jgi:hypothetical protein